MQDFIYDVEVFPNLFIVSFLDAQEGSKHVFGVFGARDTRNELRTFLDRPIRLVGYNNIFYDGAILYAITQEFKRDEPALALHKLYHLSQRLIDDNSRGDKLLQKLRYPKIKYTQLDLMKIMAFDKVGISLKQTAINLGWPKIQDLPLPYDYVVQSVDEVKLIIDYNWNDVGITKALYDAIQPKIKLRADLGKLYGVDLSNASDSKMANILLESIYAQSTGQDIAQLRDKRTSRPSVALADCISPNIVFQSPGMNRLLLDLKDIVVYKDSQPTYRDAHRDLEKSLNSPDTSDFDFYLERLIKSNKGEYGFHKRIRLNNTAYDLGVGGIHSIDNPAKFMSDNDRIIRDADVASYYPNIMLRNKLKPDHLGDNFLDILANITKERLEAKKSGNKVKAEGLKITINSIFGKLNSETFWLQDAKAFLSVTISGQLYLLMLIEALELAGITVISANTDGLIASIPTGKEEVYSDLCKQWQSTTGFELEFTDYALYVRSDVNNYITRKMNGDTKAKGRYVQEVDLNKAYKHPIVQRALFEYFVNGVDVQTTVTSCTNILDFCISQKTGGQFLLEYHTPTSKEALQKTNRFYIAMKGGCLIKRNVNTDKETGLYVGEYVGLLNDYDLQKPFGDYGVDLAFYVKEARKYIEEIEPSIVQAAFDF